MYYPSNTAVLRSIWEINWDPSSWLFIPASEQPTPNLPASFSYLDAPFAATKDNRSGSMEVLRGLTNIFGNDMFPGEQTLLLNILCGYPIYMEGFAPKVLESDGDAKQIALNGLQNGVLQTLDLHNWSFELEEVKSNGTF